MPQATIDPVKTTYKEQFSPSFNPETFVTGFETENVSDQSQWRSDNIAGLSTGRRGIQSSITGRGE